MADDEDNKGKLNVGLGVLNPYEEPDVYTDYDSTMSGVDILKNVSENSFKTNTQKNIYGYKAICLRVDLPSQNNQVGSWISNIFISTLNSLFGNDSSEPEILLSVRARIPELHASLPEPFVNCSDGIKIDQKIVDMHPAFIAIATDLSNDIPSPGDILQVDFSNRVNMTGPQYKARVLSRPVLLSVQKSAKGILKKTTSTLQTGTNEVAVTSPDPVTSEDACGKNEGKGPTCAWSDGVLIGEIDLQPIGGKNSFDGGQEMLRADVASSFIKMSAAWKLVNTKQQGLYPNSGFRSWKHQEQLYKIYLSKGTPLTAKPGKSNHQSGIAIDIAGTNDGTKKGKSHGTTALYKWLANNAYKYGFIRTVWSESWHWVYVGVSRATHLRFQKWKIYGPLGRQKKE